MFNILSIFFKDLKSYFFSMTAYVLISIFLLLTGFFFATAMSYFSIYSFQLSTQAGMGASAGFNLTDAVVTNLFFNFCVVMLLMIPILTMRSIAEEQKQGTLELLMTYPVNEYEIVIGKFAACFSVFLIMLVPTLLHLILVQSMGGILEWNVVWSGYLGLMLLGMSFIAFGIFASSLTENQIISAVISFGFLLLLWMIAWIADFIPVQIAAVINGFSMIRHVEDFFKGIVEIRHLLFYFLFMSFFVILTVWRLETRRWVR